MKKNKALIADAIQFKTAYENGNKEFPKSKLGVYFDEESNTGYSIDTLDGKQEVSLGDIIVIGMNGERYPVKPNIYQKQYGAKFK